MFNPYTSCIVFSKLFEPLVFIIVLLLLVSSNFISGYEKASFSMNETVFATSYCSLFKYFNLAGVLKNKSEQNI